MTITTPAREAPGEVAAHRRRRPPDDTRLALLFILPAFVGYVAFLVWPTLRGIYLSFTSFNLLTPAEFNGLDNYIRMAGDPVFWNAILVTTEYVVINIGVQTVLALLIAVMMQRLTKKTWLRAIMLTPYLVSNVVAALIFLWILDNSLGIGNKVLEWIGIGTIPFLTSGFWAIPTIALINVWKYVGYTALLIFAGLQAIPQHLYEVAKLDGASPFQTFRKITMPLLRPVLVLVLVVTVIGSFQVFDTVAVTTQGGPVNATRVIQYYIYQRAFTESDFGYGSAIAVILFLILALVAFIQMKFLKGNESDLD
jgi:multiple sugar transport system permease protein